MPHLGHSVVFAFLLRRRVPSHLLFLKYGVGHEVVLFPSLPLV